MQALRRALPLLAVVAVTGACSAPTTRPPFDNSNPPPLQVSIVSDPPPASDGMARNARIRITLDDFPDPDQDVFGAILLRSGGGNFDFDLSVDLVGRAIVLRPRSLLQQGVTYELALAGRFRALDGRTLGRGLVTSLAVGTTMAVSPTPAPPPTYDADIRPLLSSATCSRVACHLSGSGLPPARRLDLTGDPRDPVLGLIRVPSVGLAGTTGPLERVAPGDSAHSVLLRKLLGGDDREESRDPTSQQYPTYPQLALDGRRQPPWPDQPLVDAQLRLIQSWIDSGAL